MRAAPGKACGKTCTYLSILSHKNCRNLPIERNCSSTVLVGGKCIILSHILPKQHKIYINIERTVVPFCTTCNVSAKYTISSPNHWRIQEVERQREANIGESLGPFIAVRQY